MIDNFKLELHLQKDEINLPENIEITHDYSDNNINVKFIKETAYKGVRFKVVLQLIEARFIKYVSLKNSCELFPEDKLFLNGYQSWTDSHIYRFDSKMKRQKRKGNFIFKNYRFRQYGDYNFYNYEKKQNNLHAYSYAYKFFDNNEIKFIGSLVDKDAYTLIKFNFENKTLEIEKEFNNKIINNEIVLFDLYIAEGTEPEIIENYLKLQNINKSEPKAIKGWTSWYNYFNKIDENIILSNLENFKQNKIDLDVFQIDDGYQTAIGDWLEPSPKFPSGMKAIASKIKEAGYKAGIWIAPFICGKKSKLAKEHPDWIIRTGKKRKKPVYAAGNWSGAYILDIRIPEVLEYIKKVIHTMLNDWGFDMIKADFLYAASIVLFDDITRAEQMNEAMKFLRDCVGDDKKILACGVPLIPAFNYVDYCRIGCDVDMVWHNKRRWKIAPREQPSTLNSLKNTIHRHYLNNIAFDNDPDVFILRKKKHKLTNYQKRTLFYINHILGAIHFTSDDISKYGEDEMRTYKSSFPKAIIENVVINEDKAVYSIAFTIKERNYMLYANLADEQRSLIANRNYFYQTIDNHPFWISKEEEVVLSPHESICCVEFFPEKFDIAGTELHMFPDYEISEFKQDVRNITIKINPEANQNGRVYVTIPDNKETVIINGKECEALRIKNFKIAEYLFEQTSVKETQKEIEKIK